MRGRKLKTMTIAAVLAGAMEFGGFGPALAQNMSNPATIDDGWNFTFALNGWFPGAKGNVGVNGAPPVPVDISFGDIIDATDFGFMFVAEAQRGRFGLFVDVIYFDLSTESTNTPGLLYKSVNTGIKSSLITPMLEYRLFDERGTSLDAMAGARIRLSTVKLGFTGGLLDGKNFKEGSTRVDPTIGLKGRLALTDKWALKGWAIIGGFGVSSNFMWDVSGGLNYRFNHWFSVEAGYRAFGTDYENNGSVSNIVVRGPNIAAVFAF